MAFVRKVHIMEHDYVARSGILPDEFSDKNSQEWPKQTLITLVDATDTYMVEVIAKSNM